MPASVSAIPRMFGLGRRPVGDSLTGIVDIGSNSIRLVVYRGQERTPHNLFNEKVMAGLGRGIAANGRLSEDGMQVAEAALARFALLCDDMQVDALRTVATAAVREALNRDEFIARVKKGERPQRRGDQRR